MDDYAVVLNAGSSSLKFCVYRRPGQELWRLEVRGQVDAIGTAARFSVKDAAGNTIGEHRVDTDVHDARTALMFVATWLGARYSGANVIGVGHPRRRLGRSVPPRVVVPGHESASVGRSTLVSG